MADELQLLAEAQTPGQQSPICNQATEREREKEKE